MSIKIAVIADLHFSKEANAAIPSRKGEFADIFLLRAVHRLNRFVKPDITVIMGDLINDSKGEDALSLLKEVKDIVDKLESPAIVIPGNHDPAPDKFYTVFDRPDEFVDVKGCRFVSFLDREEPGCNASRSSEDLKKISKARESFNGQIISLQHVPLFPPDAHECPYNYLNSLEIIDEMKSFGLGLSIAGHYHEGFDTIEDGQISYIASPAFCEDPFQFMEINLEKNGKASTVFHRLKNPENAGLVDCHIHTSLAYCNENMDMRKAIKLGKAFGLEKVGFGEHSGHLYFANDVYWPGDFLSKGISYKPMSDRTGEYFENYKKVCSDYTLLGMEIDADFQGKAVIKPERWKNIQIAIGAIHYLSEFKKEHPDTTKAEEEFLAISKKFLKSGIKILAHPFRVFRRAGIPTPERLFRPLLKMLMDNNVSPEINFHTNEPSVEFFSMCLAEGVKLSFGTDSHNLYEVGEFAPHINFMEQCGFEGDLKDVLVRPEHVINKEFCL